MEYKTCGKIFYLLLSIVFAHKSVKLSNSDFKSLTVLLNALILKTLMLYCDSKNFKLAFNLLISAKHSENLFFL